MVEIQNLIGMSYTLNLNWPIFIELKDHNAYLIMGDFNEVLYIFERKNQDRENNSMRNFRNWIE